MGAGRRTLTLTAHDIPPSPPNQHFSAPNFRNLRNGQLGGVIFGCKNETFEECLRAQLFGLPFQHFQYVRNIVQGLPLFLFNYSNRRLYGIFEAAGAGSMNINPYAWTSNGSERTQFPAQVPVRVRLQCQPLSEDQFKPIIYDNYYTKSHFWFELDHAQTSKLMSKLSSQPIAPGSFKLQNQTNWTIRSHGPPSDGTREGSGKFKQPDPENAFPESQESSGEDYLFLNDDNQKEDMPDKELIYMKLKELAVKSEGSAEERDFPNEDMEHGTFLEEGDEDLNGKNDESSSSYPSVIAQLIEEIKELNTFKETQQQKVDFLEQEIHDLKTRCMKLEMAFEEPLNLPDLDPKESIYLIGGYNGESLLSSLDLYSPATDLIKPLHPMTSARCYAATAKLNGELYVFGGGTGSVWYDTVESYDPAKNLWSLHPSLNKEKGSLAGAALNDKIFAMGGGNGCDCFSDVEMYDLHVGRWICTRSMMKERFALAGVELNGALYAVGGYDGVNYLKSGERFDPREHSWTRIESMGTERGCHVLVAMEEKLYALGGFDGSSMVASTEVYEPRVGKWVPGEAMNQCRGYLAAAAVKESIVAIGGVRSGEDIVETVEVFKEGEGWQEKRSGALGKWCFGSAVCMES